MPLFRTPPLRICFVYRPGDPLGTRGNVFTDWSAMFVAMADIEGCKDILVDDSFTSPALVPAGSYDLTDVVIKGINGPLTLLHIQDGAVFTSSRTTPAFDFDSIVIRNLGTAAVMTPVAGAAIFLRGTRIEASGFALITVTGGSVMSLDEGAIIGGAPADSVEVVGSPFFVIAGDSALIEVDAFTGPGSVQVIVISDSAEVRAQTVLGGTFSVNSNSPGLGILSDRWQVPAVGTLAGIHGALHRVDTTAGSVTINLPASIPGTVGQPIIGKKTDGGANDLIMNPAGGDTISGLDRTSGIAFGVIHLVDNGDGSWSTIHPTGE